MPSYVEKSIEDAISVYKDLGAEIVEVSLPNINLSLPIYYIIAPAECSANLRDMMVFDTDIGAKILKI